MVGDECLQPADGHRYALPAHGARALAQELLRAEPAAHLGHRTRLAELVRGAGEIPSFQEDESGGNIVVERTGLRAGSPRALNAAKGFQAGRLFVEGKGDFVPVERTLARVLLGERLSGELESFFGAESGRG